MYIFLSILYLIVAYIAGSYASKARTPKMYWRFVIFPVIVYSIMYGFRYGWMVDFNLYEEDYKSLAHNDEKGKLGWLFYIIFRVGSSNDINYNIIITFLNFLLIVSYCCITFYYRKYAKWILPLFYFVSRMTANFIAFYPAIGFFCLFMVVHLQTERRFNFRSITNRELLIPAILLLIAFGLHPAVIAALGFYVIVCIVRLKPTYAILCYLLSFTFQTETWLSIMEYASTYLILFSSNDTISAYNNYAENAESFYSSHVFTGRSSPIFFYIRNCIANSAALILYYKYSIKNNVDINKTKILELSTVALVLTNMTEGVELFQRYGMLFRTFLPILYSYSVAYGLQSYKKSERLMAIAIIVLIGQYYISDAFFAPDDDYKYLYIWDK